MPEKLHDDGLAQLWLADARDMSFLEDGSVDCIVTSPPYWSLRKYGEGAELVWDAAEGCEHVWGAFITDPVRPVNRRCDKCKKFGVCVRTIGDQLEVHCSQCGHITKATSDTKGVLGETEKWLNALRGGGRGHTEQVKQGQFCQLCGAWRGQLGLEPTIELYLDHLLQILDVECGRVLKDSGVMWVNMGDSYASSPSNQHSDNVGARGSKAMTRQKRTTGLKPLDLCMIPARFALAMQQRGWYLRSIVPWLKRASMPDSIQGDRWERHRLKVDGMHGDNSAIMLTEKSHRSGLGEKRAEWADCPGCPKCIPNGGLVLRKGNWRPGRSLEWLFLFSKTNDYYSDTEGVRKGTQVYMRRAGGYKGHHKQMPNDYSPFKGKSGFADHDVTTVGRNRRESDWLYESLDAIIAHHEAEARRLKHLRDNGGMLWEDGEPLVLLLNPKGYKEAHFATYPIAMVEPLIKAYTSEKGNCPKCGMAWVRIIKPSEKYAKQQQKARDRQGGEFQSGIHSYVKAKGQANPSVKPQWQTLGWRPSCECPGQDGDSPWPNLEMHPDGEGNWPSVPAVVCDPFVGSGTTCAAATKLGRRSIGVDIVPEYIELAIKRLGGPFTVETKDGVKVKQQGLFREL